MLLKSKTFSFSKKPSGVPDAARDLSWRDVGTENCGFQARRVTSCRYCSMSSLWGIVISVIGLAGLVGYRAALIDFPLLMDVISGKPINNPGHAFSAPEIPKENVAFSPTAIKLDPPDNYSLQVPSPLNFTDIPPSTTFNQAVPAARGKNARAEDEEPVSVTLKNGTSRNSQQPASEDSVSLFKTRQ